MKKSSLLSYSILISKKWIFWLFALLDIIALIAQYVDPSLRFPQIVYVLLALFGFLWAGFDIYRETTAKQEGLERERMAEHETTLRESAMKHEIELKEYREALATLTGKTQLEEIDLTPKLGILLTEGNEYEFSLSMPIKPQTGFLLAGALIASKLIPNEDDNQEEFDFSESEIKKLIKEGQVEYHASAAKLRIHLRVDNLGIVPVDILSIEASIDEGDAPFYCSSPTPIGKDDKEFAELIPSIKFPIILSPGTIYFCDLISRVSPRGDTSAQFAAGLRDYRAKREFVATLSIDIDAMDSNGARCGFNQELKVSLRPLIDLYISEWHELGQSDLLRIAGYKSNAT